jgi:hypothetical protein
MRGAPHLLFLTRYELRRRLFETQYYNKLTMNNYVGKKYYVPYLFLEMRMAERFGMAVGPSPHERPSRSWVSKGPNCC